MKFCSNPSCTQLNPQPLENFSFRNRRTGNRTSWCRKCTNEKVLEIKKQNPRYYLKRKYNITPERYKTMLKAQGYGCAICGDLDPNDRELAVDHDRSCCSGDRSCGKCVRQLLCGPCNLMLGIAHDRDWVLERAAEYIRDNKKAHMANNKIELV